MNADVAMIVGGAAAFAGADLAPEQYRNLLRVGGLGLAAVGVVRGGRELFARFGFGDAPPAIVATPVAPIAIPRAPDYVPPAGSTLEPDTGIVTGGPTAPIIDDGGPVKGSFLIPLVGRFIEPMRGGVARRAASAWGFSLDYDVRVRIENRSDRAISDYVVLDIEESYVVGGVERATLATPDVVTVQPGRDVVVAFEVDLLKGLGALYQQPNVIARLRFAGRVLDTIGFRVA